MPFVKVFDVAREGYSTWWFPAFGLIFVAIGGLLVFRPGLVQRYMRPRRLNARVFGWSYFIFGVLWTVATFVSTYTQYHTAASDLSNGRYEVVEGPVTNFVPMPSEGGSLESFVVGGRRFSYKDSAAPGFHTTARHGGPIREGLYVRVTYSGDLILRLEIAR